MAHVFQCTSSLHKTRFTDCKIVQILCLRLFRNSEITIIQFRCANKECRGNETFFSNVKDMFFVDGGKLKIKDDFKRQFFASVNHVQQNDSFFVRKKHVSHTCRPLSEKDVAELEMETTVIALAKSYEYSVNAATLRRVISDIQKKYRWAPYHDLKFYLKKMNDARRYVVKKRRKLDVFDSECNLVPQSLAALTYNFNGDPLHETRWPVVQTLDCLMRKFIDLTGFLSLLALKSRKL
jgi:hypothetical protein